MIVHRRSLKNRKAEVEAQRAALVLALPARTDRAKIAEAVALLKN